MIYSEDYEFLSKLKSFTLHSEDIKHRRTGRTFAFLRCLIENGIETDENMSLNDHLSMYHRFDDKMRKRDIIHDICKVIKWYADRGVYIDFYEPKRDVFRFTLSQHQSKLNYEKLRIEPHVYKSYEPYCGKMFFSKNEEQLLLI